MHGISSFKFESISKYLNEDDAYRAEIETINKFSEKGISLLNITPGGGGRQKMSSDERIICSQHFKALWKCSTYRNKMKYVLSRPRGPRTYEIRKRISESVKLNWASDKEKACKRIEKLLKMLRSDEFRQKSSIKQKEIAQRPEVKAKISAARVKRNEYLRKTVNDIRNEYAIGNMTQKELAIKFNMKPSQVKGIIAGKIYKYLIDN